MRKLPLILGAMIALHPLWTSAQSTVNYSAGPGQRDVMAINNTPLANGNYVSIGTFNTGFNVANFSRDLMALDAAWNEFGFTTIRTIFSQPGSFADNDSSTSSAFDNQQLWLWIFQTTDNAAPNSTYSNVAGYGLFTSSSGNWLIPPQGSAPPNNTTSINSSEVNSAAFGLFSSSHLTLQPVPEPTLVPLLLVGAGLLYGWTRRGFKQD